jgi:arylformamidase
MGSPRQLGRRRTSLDRVVLRVHIDLSHDIVDGMVTYPGLPEPIVDTHLSREAAEEIYGPGITFQIGLVTMCTNTGTYLDVPFHRYADGHDLSELALERVAGVPAVCLDRRGVTDIELSAADLDGLAGHAVLVRTDHSQHFGAARYFEDHPYLSAESADRLVDAGVACVGIDSLNIDNIDGGGRPCTAASSERRIRSSSTSPTLRSCPPMGSDSPRCRRRSWARGPSRCERSPRSARPFQP